MNNEFRIRRGQFISTEIRVPGDKSISQRVIVLAALANGPSVISGFLPCVECTAAVDACRARRPGSTFSPGWITNNSGHLMKRNRSAGRPACGSMEYR
jgi:hypothetical protein